MAAGVFSFFTSPVLTHNILDDQRKRLVVIGGGAAGFFCAVNAARMHPSLEVIILEKTNKLLSKVRVSGGGRCNVTHACFEIAEIAKRYPRGANFVKKTFHQFFTTDTIQWFKERGVLLKVEPDGRMFPQSNTSQTIVDCLMNEAERYGVAVQTQSEVVSLECGVVSTGAAPNVWDDRITIAQKFTLKISSAGTTGYRLLTTDYLCIACGGYPKSSMFSWLTATGHSC